MHDPPSRRLLLVLLMAAWLVVDVVLAAGLRPLVANSGTWEIAALVVVLGLFFGQTATLAGWLALGDGSWLIRLALAVAGFSGLSALMWMLHPERTDHWFVVDLMYFGLVLAGLLVPRLCRFRCEVRSVGVASAAPRFQFSILQILILTTGVAVALKILQSMRLASPPGSLVETMLIELALAGIAWVTWLAMLRLPPLAGLATTLGAAMLLGWLAGAVEQMEIGIWIAFALIQALALAGNLVVLRIAGYELHRSGAAQTIGTPPDSAPAP